MLFNKKNIKKYSALIISGIITLGVTGCGSNTENPPESKQENIDYSNVDPLEIIQNASNVMTNLESLDVLVDVDIQMSMMGTLIDSLTTTSVNAFLSPAKMNLKVKSDNSGTVQNAHMYVSETDDEILTFIDTDEEWIVQGISKEDLHSLQPQNQVVDIIDNINEAVIIDAYENNDGVKVYSIDAVLSQEDMLTVAEANGTLATAEMLGVEWESILEMLGDLDESSVNLVIGENGYIYGYTVDMSIMLEKVIGSSLELALGVTIDDLNMMGMGITIEKVIVEIECSNFNNVADFQIPEDILVLAE